MVFVRNSGVLVRILCFCEDVVLEWVGGRVEGGIVNFVSFCMFRSGFCLAENSVKLTSKFHRVQFVRELPRTLGTGGKSGSSIL